MQVQLTEIKNKMSEYVRAVQNGSTFEITVRGVPVAMGSTEHASADDGQ